MIIYRLTDRIPVKIAKLTFWIAPLSFEQKSNLLDCKKMEAGKEVVDGGKRAKLALQYAIKKVDGLKCSDGTDYALKMDEAGNLSDESVDELSGLNCLGPLVSVCLGLMNGVSDMKVEGVEINLKGVVSEKKA